MIEECEPETWRDLEQMAARILRECGFAVACGQEVRLVRGSTKVDVRFIDDGSLPSATVLVECKHWKTRVTKAEVHAFRTVVADAGANGGLLLSSAGFQSGARDAAAQSNVRLVTWREFEEIYEVRWTDRHVRPRLNLVFAPLLELARTYSQDEDARLARLSPEQVDAVWARTGRLEPLASLAEELYQHGGFTIFRTPEQPIALPLVVSRSGEDLIRIPAHLHDIRAARPFVEAMMAEGFATNDAIDGIIAGTVSVQG